MRRFSRRSFVAGAMAAASLAAPLSTARAESKVLRVGYQKYGTLILLKARGLLEKKLEPLGWAAKWAEFPSGPPLLEALDAGALDIGSAGETPPIFAQAAGGDLVYVGHEPPSPLGEAIIVPKDSPIRSLADLKGKRIVLNKGSNVHYLLVAALEAANIAYSDIHPIYLSPADGRAAFERGLADAWAIWDPFLAAAQATTEARTLATGENLVKNPQFYLASGKFLAQNPTPIDALLAAVNEVDAWIAANPRAAADELSPGVGIPAAALEIALTRQAYGATPLAPEMIANQQKIADTFFKLGLVPKAMRVADIVRKSAA